MQGTHVLTVIYKQTWPYIILSYCISVSRYWPQSCKSISILKTQSHKIDMISPRFNSLSASGVMGLAKCCNGSTVTRMSGVLGSRVRRFEGFFACQAERKTQSLTAMARAYQDELFLQEVIHVICRGCGCFSLQIPCTSKKASRFLPTNLPAFLNLNQDFTIGTA